VSDQQAFDFKEGAAAAEEAIARVEANAADEWKAAALGAARCAAERLDLFTTDDVWKLLIDRGVAGPHEPRAMGPIMRQAVSLGFCEGTDGFKRSERVSCHTRPLRVWKSLIFGKVPWEET